MTKAAIKETDNTGNVTVMEPQKIAVYNEFRSQLAELKKNNSVTLFDYESKKGNTEARSYIHKLRRTKAAVDEARKREKAASLEYGRKVDGEAKEIIEELEQMIDVHQKEIDKIEEREDKRLADIKTGIDNIRNMGDGIIFGEPQPLDLCLLELDKMVIDNCYAEFKEEATAVKELALKKVKDAIADQTRQRLEREENERLRKELEDFQQKERDEKIRKDAEEKARIEADAKAKQEREEADRKLETERKRAEDDRVAAQNRELNLKLEKERAEKEKAEAELREKNAKEKAEIDRIAAAEKAARDQEQARLDAIETERLRVETETKAREEAEAKRKADEDHRGQINNDAAMAMTRIMKENKVTGKGLALAIIEAIANGEIPHISIQY